MQKFSDDLAVVHVGRGRGHRVNQLELTVHT
jgi:hypothetical protein